MDALQESLSQLQKMFIDRMDVYQGELHAAGPSPTVATLSADFTAFRGFIMAALRSLQDQVGLIAHQTDTIEMRSRRKILLLHGVSEAKNEETSAAVVKVILGLNISTFSASDISRCHRMGRTPNAERPRPILLKLRAMDIRNKIWISKTGLKGTGITLSEFLTKPRHVTFMAARHRFGVNKCWTREGFVFVLGAAGERHRISSLAELDKLADPGASKPAPSLPKGHVAVPKARRAAAVGKRM